MIAVHLKLQVFIFKFIFINLKKFPVCGGSTETMTHWHENSAIVQKRWPELWHLCLRGVARHRVEVVQDGVLVDGLHLFSLFDPSGEARVQAERVPPGSPEAFLYGLGSAHLPEVLLARRELQRLTVVLLDIGLFCQSLATMDHQVWLADPRTILATWEEFPAPRSPFAVTPTALRLTSPEPAAKKLATRIRLSLEENHLDRRFLEHPLLMEKIRQNKKVMDQDPGVETLFDSYPGSTILVAGAGPTLSDHLTILANRSAKSILIAVDAALLPLRQAGILPDVVVTQEYHPIVFTLFQDMEEDISLARIPLVYFPASDPEVLAAWPGPRRVACSHSPIYAVIRQQRGRSILFASGSVLHPAVDLAVRMGAARVVLVGADFSFPGGASHAEGCAAMRWNSPYDTALTLSNGQGEEVPTSHALNSMLLELEDYLCLHPDVAFFNASRRGARIAGARDLDEVHNPLLPASPGTLPLPWKKEQAPIPALDVTSLLRQADACLLVYRYARAERILKDLLENLSPEQAPRERILIQCGAAEILLHRNRIDQAETLVSEALATARRLNPGQRQAILLRVVALRGMAAVHMLGGDSRTAASLLEDVRSLTYALDDAQEKARTGRIIAIFLHLHGRFQAARQQLLETRAALLLAEKKGHPLPLEDARCLMDLGHLTAGSGAWSETREYFSQAWVLYQRHEEKTAAAMARHALFTLRRDMQQALQIHPGNCQGHMTQTVRLFRQGHDTEGAEAMKRLIDCALRRLEDKEGIDPELVNPLLARILDAQKRNDFIQIADDLAHRLAPVWLG
ncbi:MAG: DUF115 domain-containing protein [Magnetococcales bacterium]|nr:DUF115 domain-containing protein [Magnetococcales bacterium]